MTAVNSSLESDESLPSTILPMVESRVRVVDIRCYSFNVAWKSAECKPPDKLTGGLTIAGTNSKSVFGLEPTYPPLPVVFSSPHGVQLETPT